MFIRKIRSVHPSVLAKPLPPAQPVSAEDRRRRESLVMRPEVLGVRFASHPSVPAAVWNRAVSAMAQAFQNLVGTLECAYRDGIEESLEELIHTGLPEAANSWGRCNAEAVLNEEHGFFGSRLRCDVCSEALEFEGNKPRKMLSTMGSLRFSRAYYHCKCGHSIFPLDQLLGLDEHGVEAQLQYAIALCAARMPYAEAVELVETLLPVNISTHTAQQITATHARGVRKSNASRGHSSGNQTTPSVAVVGADGGMCHTRDQLEPYKEVKLGVLGRLEPTPGAHSEVEDKTYVAHLGNANDFFRLFTTKYYQEGLHRAGTLVGIADGAAWIWDRLTQLLAPGQEFIGVLDFYHASEHLRALSCLLFGEESLDGKDWWRKMKGLLMDGRLAPFFRELTRRYNAASNEDTRAEIGRERRYFLERRDKLRYKECRDRGLPIGSGMVEGGVRFVIKDRLDRTGMRWNISGAQDILTLRAADASSQWTRTCAEMTATRRNAYTKAKTVWLRAA